MLQQFRLRARAVSRKRWLWFSVLTAGFLLLIGLWLLSVVRSTSFFPTQRDPEAVTMVEFMHGACRIVTARRGSENAADCYGRLIMVPWFMLDQAPAWGTFIVPRDALSRLRLTPDIRHASNDFPILVSFNFMPGQPRWRTFAAAEWWQWQLEPTARGRIRGSTVAVRFPLWPPALLAGSLWVVYAVRTARSLRR